MLDSSNIKKLLSLMGFKIEERSQERIYTKYYEKSNSKILVNLDKQTIELPVCKGRQTTVNFAKPENFVVLECVNSLFSKGYYPNDVEVEHLWKGAGGAKRDYWGDIVISIQGKAYCIIECKTAKSFDGEWRKMQEDGGQLFSYFQQESNAKFLCLYYSDIVNDRIKQKYYLISVDDNKELLSKKKLSCSYKVGNKFDKYTIWKDIYGFDKSTRGLMEPNIKPYVIGEQRLTVNDLTPLASEHDIDLLYNKFASILRLQNISNLDNAFDKLVNLILAKIVDEFLAEDDDKFRNIKNIIGEPVDNESYELQFYWHGPSFDNQYRLIDRLFKLYMIGMKKFLGEDVTYVEDSDLDNALGDIKEDTIGDSVRELFHKLKFYTNNDFSFIDVHNQKLFEDNAEALIQFVDMFKDFRLRTQSDNHYLLLSNLFELLLDKGVKQSQGQFFTPPPVVKYMVSSLPLQKMINDNSEPLEVIDYACGALHFLTEYASQIKNYINYENQDKLKSYYASITGIEKEYRLAKVSKVSAFMYGQDEIKVIYGDALASNDSIKDASYDILLANPPYSVKGFLNSLSYDDRLKYSLFSSDIDLEKNGSIEAFFIERATQLLKDDGVAAIVLPSSILTKNGIYISTREIILSSFEIKAISEFGNGTFGKTTTNTVAVFLKRRKRVNSIADKYRQRISSWFKGDFKKDSIYNDSHYISDYCSYVGYEEKDFRVLMDPTSSINDILSALSRYAIFEEYSESLSPEKKSNDTTKGINEEASKIRSQIKTRVSQKSFKDLPIEQQTDEINSKLVLYIQAIEKEKLLYYILARNNNSQVVLVNCPSEKKEMKSFLGYEWCTAKGNEGINYLNVPSKPKVGESENGEDDRIRQRLGIKGIQTPLFNPTNFEDTSKINSIIRGNFCGTELSIPKGCQKYVRTCNLEELLDFSQPAFDKSINTSGRTKTVISSKYPMVKLGTIADVSTGVSAPQDPSCFIEGVYPFFRTSDVAKAHLSTHLVNTEDYLNDFGKQIVSGKKEKNLWKAGTILFPKSGASTYLDHRAIMGVDGYVVSHLATIIADETKILTQFLFNLLTVIRARDIKPGSGYPSLNASDIANLKIPLPNIAKQEDFNLKFDKLNKKYESTKMSPEKFREEALQLFSNEKIMEFEIV